MFNVAQVLAWVGGQVFTGQAGSTKSMLISMAGHLELALGGVFGIGLDTRMPSKRPVLG